MSWAKLLGDRHVTALPPSKAELDNLRSIVARSLKDAAATGLSADARNRGRLCERLRDMDEEANPALV